MAVFIVLWPYLLTAKLKFVIRHNLGHSTLPVAVQNWVIFQDILQISESSRGHLHTVHKDIECHNSKTKDDIEEITVLEISHMP